MVSGASQPDARATLEAWRARGADRMNPVRFRFIEALERRAAGQDGEVRRVLDDRLAALLAEYAGEIERIAAHAVATRSEPTHGTPAAAGNLPPQGAPHRGALGELADLLARRVTAAARNEASAAHDALAPHHPERAPDVPVLDYFRETWSKFSTQKQLHQSLEQVPDNAGPLNSNSLVHRSLSLMREVSPAYLQQFLSYVEALAWMERLAGPFAGAAASPVAEATRTGGGKKNAKRKAR